MHNRVNTIRETGKERGAKKTMYKLRFYQSGRAKLELLLVNQVSEFDCLPDFHFE